MMAPGPISRAPSLLIWAETSPFAVPGVMLNVRPSISRLSFFPSVRVASCDWASAAIGTLEVSAAAMIAAWNPGDFIDNLLSGQVKDEFGLPSVAPRGGRGIVSFCAVWSFRALRPPDRPPRDSQVNGLALIGSLRTRLPVAAKTALVSA